MSPQPYSAFLAVPEIDIEIADALFATDDRADQANLRDMFREMELDVGRRLDRLHADASEIGPDQARKELHPLKGNAGSFGFARCAAILGHLELGWAGETPAARRELLGAARRLLHEGAGALRQRHPYLAAAD